MASPPEWTKLRERSTKDFHIFQTHTWDVADPRNGQTYIRTIIDAPDWVNVVALTADGSMVLVRQFRFGTWSNTLEIPGGMVDPGEAPEVGAARELEEETGFRAAQVRVIGVSHPNPAIFSNRLHTYLATGCVKVHDGKQDGSEDIRVEVVSRAQVRALVLDGSITHSLVLAALLYAEWV